MEIRYASRLKLQDPLQNIFSARNLFHMRYTKVVEHFGSELDVALALGISRQAVNLWKSKDLVPEGTAYKLQVITAGRLRVDPRLYESKRITA